MPNAARKDDTNSHGNGKIIPQVTTVLINGLLASVVGDNSTPDNFPHDNPKTSTGSETIIIEGKPAHRKGDSRICGATTVTGSPNVLFG